MKINKLLGILLIVTIGCSTSMVGKQMPPANYIKVSPKLQHIDLKLIKIDLRTEIDSVFPVNMRKSFFLQGKPEAV
jgi:hypothetical protein